MRVTRTESYINVGSETIIDRVSNLIGLCNRIILSCRGQLEVNVTCAPIIEEYYPDN